MVRDSDLLHFQLYSLATNTLDQLLQAKSEEFQTYFRQKTKELVEQLNGNNQTGYADYTKDLKKKLSDKNSLVSCWLFGNLIHWFLDHRTSRQSVNVGIWAE